MSNPSIQQRQAKLLEQVAKQLNSLPEDKRLKEFEVLLKYLFKTYDRDTRGYTS